MPATILTIGDYTAHPGEYSLLLVQLPGQREETAGVLLFDPATDELHIKLRREWPESTSEDDLEVLEALQDDLEAKAREFGGRALLEMLEADASQTIRITGRTPVVITGSLRTLSRLYREQVPVAIRPYRTHLPFYPLQVAAGPFLANAAEAEPQDWIEVPADLRPREGMFVATIRGHSMEPDIPDGSLCVFRRGVTGSRNGRLVLARDTMQGGEDGYTVKRYRSEKIVTEEGFEHTRIRLESLNPASPSWDLDVDEHRYQIVAEFVRVLE